jgi:C6 transcription factor Pro1
MMPAHERSTFGCWTCRIRKKKCDEKYPICEACYARSITCYGYGPKPEWMDGGEKERKVLHELKREVKENLKQRKASGSVIPPPIPTGDFSSMYGGSWPSQSRTISNLSYLPPPPTAIQSCPTSLSPGYQDSVSDDPTFPIPAQAGDCGASDTNSKSNDLESTLLMNYLDHVFPLQFNCYVPPVVELGRGWLLALLTRTKPLYHAALAISAFYMHSVILKTGRSRTRCMNNHWEAMKIHHALAFQELQIQISASNHGEKVASLKESIEILACIIQLVSFEVCFNPSESFIGVEPL